MKFKILLFIFATDGGKNWNNAAAAALARENHIIACNEE